MDTASLSWNAIDGWQPASTPFAPDLVLYFGSRETLTDSARYQELREKFPDACLMGCSTGGQICGDEIVENGVNAVAVRFDGTAIRTAIESAPNAGDSRIYGEAIGRALASDDLAGVFVLSDGLAVNGSELVAGIGLQVGDVPISGGLAGDGSQFVETMVGLDCPPEPRKNRGNRVLRPRDQDRSRQRRRLGCVRAEAADHLGQGKRAVPAGRPAGT